MDFLDPRNLALKTGGPPVVELMMPLDELLGELDGLTPIHAAEIDREIIEGRGHTGMGAVTQLIARKPA